MVPRRRINAISYALHTGHDRAWNDTIEQVMNSTVHWISSAAGRSFVAGGLVRIDQVQAFVSHSHDVLLVTKPM